MREYAGIDALSQPALYTAQTVFLNIVSPRSQALGRVREGIKSLQYIIETVEDAEEGIALNAERSPLGSSLLSRG